jgi:hypothetical protein
VEKNVVGLVEKVRVIGERSVEAVALFDTGARLTSVDIKLASKAQMGPIVRITKVKNPSFNRIIKRPVVRAKIKVKGKIFDVDVNIQDRSHMTFPVIIGRNIITGNFIVDPTINKGLHKEHRINFDKERNPSGI